MMTSADLVFPTSTSTTAPVPTATPAPLPLPPNVEIGDPDGDIPDLPCVPDTIVDFTCIDIH